jgi:hypothetical protein
MRRKDIWLEDGERAPRRLTGSRPGADWTEARRYYDHARLAAAIERFTALATMGGTPIHRCRSVITFE